VSLTGGISTDHIVGNPDLRKMAMNIMDDVIIAANTELSSRGHPESHIPQSFHDLMFHLTDEMGPYMTSTALDYLADLPMEIEYMFTKPLERARRLGVNVPYMGSVVRIMKGINALKEKGVIKR